MTSINYYCIFLFDLYNVINFPVYKSSDLKMMQLKNLMIEWKGHLILDGISDKIIWVLNNV